MVEHSEFGGAPGLIQPAPHSPSAVAREAAFLERAVDPWQTEVGVEAVLADVLAGKYPSVPPQEPAEILPLTPNVDFVAISNEGETLSFTGLGNKDLRTARIKLSSSRGMVPHTFGPEKEYSSGVFSDVELEIGSVAPGNYYYQILMNNIQVTDVWEVEVV